MLCQKCNENNASVHYVQDINGHKKELHLCPKCAAEMGFAGSMPYVESLGSMLGGFFEDMGGFGNLLSGFGGLYDNTSDTDMGLACKSCGMDLSELGKSSFLGCPDCYSAFEGILANNLDRFQRGHRHTGKRPGRLGGSRNLNSNEKKQTGRLSEIDRLKEELKNAVKDENYEKAAQLRDKIKELGEK